MAGYSGTPLLTKLGVEDDTNDVVLAFTECSELERRIAALGEEEHRVR